MAGVDTQLLPATETFEKPDWALSTAGSAQDHCLPWYFHAASWNPTNSLLASDSEYAACPLRTGGLLECRDFGVMFAPAVDDASSPIPVHVTDKHGESQSKTRAFVLREETTFDRADLSFEAQFGMSLVGGAILGQSQQGSGGSSPYPLGVRSFPTTDDSGATGSEHSTIWTVPNGTATMGGNQVEPPISVKASQWVGSGVAVRMGGGRPTLVSSGASATISSSWSWRRVDCYILCAYPQVSGGDIDLIAEIWRFTTNSSDQIIPRQMVKQVIDNGANSLSFLQPYHLRLEIDDVSGNPTMTAYLGLYTQGGATAERQLFRSGVFTSDTISIGPSGDGAVVTSTGVVTDSGADKITTYTGRTCGVLMGRDRNFNDSNIIEGLYRLTARRTDTNAIIWNDRFERTCEAVIGPPHVDEQIVGLYSAGFSRMGRMLFDVDALSNVGTNNLKIRRSALWTSGITSVSSPTDYLTQLYDPDPGTNGSITSVTRWFWDRRPSTQLYNHSRKISFVGPTDDAPSLTNTFRVGLSCRGVVVQYFQEVIAFYADYTTDGSGNQTSLTLRIGKLRGFYSETYTNGEVVLAENVIHSSGSPPAGYDIAGGTKRTMQIDIVTDAEGTHTYTAYWDGTAVTFTTFGQDCTQDATSKAVTHPSPPSAVTEGRTEGFFMVSQRAAGEFVDAKWEDWLEGTLVPDGGLVEGATIAVEGEGTPTVNLSTAVYIDWTLTVQTISPRYEAAFASGHRYTSPQFGKSRRVISARATNVTKAEYDALVAFYNARGGVEEPFYFDFPIASTLGSNTLTTIAVRFTKSALRVRREAEGVYTVELEMVEVFV